MLNPLSICFVAVASEWRKMGEAQGNNEERESDKCDDNGTGMAMTAMTLLTLIMKTTMNGPHNNNDDGEDVDLVLQAAKRVCAASMAG